MHRSRITARRAGRHLPLLLLALAGAAQADIVTLGLNPQPLPDCPALGLPGLCRVDTAAQVRDTVTDYSKVRIGQGGSGSLAIGSGTSLFVNRLDLAPGIPSSPDVVVGDNVGAVGGLSVSNGGQLSLTVADAGGGSGGLIVGAFAAPTGATGPSTTMAILDGGQVRVDKVGGIGVGAAVGVGYGAGSNSSLLLDGGIQGFGNQAHVARLDTTGNLSIGREGQGSVDLFRYAAVTANQVTMSVVGLAGQSVLSVGLGSRLDAQRVLAGIGLGNGPTGYDVNNPNHGTAVVSTRDDGLLNAQVVLGSGGTLMGNGTVGSVLNLGGTVRPGFSPGHLTVAGDFVDENGLLQIEIGAGASDFISVGGALSLHGTSIQFRFIDGFAPTTGFQYDFIAADDGVDLQDLSFSTTGLADGFSFSVDTDPATGRVVFHALNDARALPEPPQPALLALALLAAAGVRRRLASRTPRAPHWGGA